MHHPVGVLVVVRREEPRREVQHEAHVHDEVEGVPVFLLGAAGRGERCRGWFTSLIPSSPGVASRGKTLAAVNNETLPVPTAAATTCLETSADIVRVAGSTPKVAKELNSNLHTVRAAPRRVKDGTGDHPPRIMARAAGLSAGLTACIFSMCWKDTKRGIATTTYSVRRSPEAQDAERPPPSLVLYLEQ